MTTMVIVGGSTGLGRVIAERAAARGETVFLTSRDQGKADAIAKELGHGARGLAIDLTRPETIAASLASIPEVDHLVVTAIEQSVNTMKDFDIASAIRVVTVKLVGYAEVARALRPRFRPGASIVLFGGLAKDRPYPGSTMVTTFNGGVAGLTRTLAVELAPHRVNTLHAGVVGDSPKWRDVPNHPHVPRTPLGRLVTMAEVAEATEFLLTCTGVNGVELYVDGGVRLT